MIAAGFARLLSAPLARAEALDPTAAARRAAFAPTRLAVEVSDLGWALTLYINRSGSRIYPGRDSAAEATLVGPLAALLALAAEPDRPLPGSGVRLYGSPGQLGAVVGYLRGVRPDWAGLVQRLFGPLPAAGAATAANAGRDWLGRAVRPEVVADYLVYDARLAVSAADGRDLARELAEIRARSDRLEARLDALERSAPSVQE